MTMFTCTAHVENQLLRACMHGTPLLHGPHTLRIIPLILIQVHACTCKCKQIQACTFTSIYSSCMLQELGANDPIRSRRGASLATFLGDIASRAVCWLRSAAQRHWSPSVTVQAATVRCMGHNSQKLKPDRKMRPIQFGWSILDAAVSPYVPPQGSGWSHSSKDPLNSAFITRSSCSKLKPRHGRVVEYQLVVVHASGR
jgi:hypothetical protein